MKKIIKLTESDLERLVKRIIKENDDLWMANTYNQNQHTEEEMNKVWEELNELNNDQVFELMDLTFNERRMSVEDFVNRLPSHMVYDYDYLVSVLKQIQEEGI
jgi:basic membrane lipoprotein Med (substrate-binding protein (PBP1-ABC) superfamily)